jgi:3',5'-cyclic-AMP phosphodiesterase
MNPVEDPVTFVVPGDLHLTEPGLDNHRVALRLVEEANELIRPDFVQFIGDNVQDATGAQFRLFDDLRGRLACPHFAIVGDHDVKDDPGASGFRSRFGETFGSTSLRGFRFLRLDTQRAKPLGMSGDQVEWFRDEVDAALSAGERPVVFQHNYPYQIWENFDGPCLDEWRAIVQTRRITAVLCGHTHYWQVSNDGRNVSIAVRSIGDPEGGPPGYLVGHLAGDDFAVTYRSPDAPGPLVLITHPREAILATGPTHVVTGRDRLEVRAWSTGVIESVLGRLDDSEWFAMEPAPGRRWTAPLDGGRLAKGAHRFAVRALDLRGLEGHHEVDFLVDPTGRYTAVPTSVPAVEATAFC